MYVFPMLSPPSTHLDLFSLRPESIPATLGLGIYTSPPQAKHHSRFLPKPPPPHVVSFCTVVAKLGFAPPVKSWFQYPCTSWMAMLDDGELMLDGLVGE